MATLGDLVVNLTANTSKYTAGMGLAQRAATNTTKGMNKIGPASNRFASAITSAARRASRAMIGMAKMPLRVGNAFLGAARGASGFFAALAVGAGAAKIGGLAIDAEQLQVKFRVLLKSGDAASAMLKDIGDFAASTPFQKMDIAEAAQKLLAFGVPAEKIMKSIRQIGDISALTGNSIGEMAELYGKANVQGRLFMEDINQLTGRGIPIIQQLASQFGVAESKVRDLVSSGKVTATNLQIAFADMTSAGGDFANGMDQLSQTTGGKLSTLRDKVSEIATTFGSKFLPAINSATDAIMSGFSAAQPYVDSFGDKILALGSDISESWSTTQNDIAGGVVQAMAIAEYAMENWRTIAELAFKTAALGAVKFFSVVGHFFLKAVPSYLTHLSANWKTVFQNLWDNAKKVFSNIGKNIKNLWSAMKSFATGGGFNFEWQGLTDGLKKVITNMPDIPPRIIGNLEKGLMKDVANLELTVGTGLKDAIEPRLRELSKMQEEAKKRSGIKTPTVPKPPPGADGPQNKPAGAGDTVKETKFAGIMTGGDAFATVVKAMRGNSPELKETKAQTKVLKKIEQKISKPADKTEIKLQGAV